MKKQHIIIIAVVIAAWAAFMGYRHIKGKQGVEEHREAEYGRMIKTAKLSPRAGLAQMGTALQKYYKEKNAYPSNLNELYPTHVGSKAFIDEIDWYYEPRGDNFFLSKTVIRDNKRMIASVDKALNPRMETGVMVATPTPAPEPAVEAPQAPAVQAPGVSIQSREEFWEALRQRQMGVTAESLADRRKPSVLLLARRPEIVSVDESKVISEAEFEVSEKYLVWKDSQGVLGLGDAQLPATQRQTIYAEGNWYDIKVPLPMETQPVAFDTGPEEMQVDPEVIASNMSQRYLVWKGQQGTLGFGNIEYPAKDRVTAYQDNEWVGVQKPLPPAKTTVEQDRSQEEQSTDTIASELGTRYLVWKDEQTLGFGNVAYPAKDRVSAYQDNEWVGVQKPAPLAKTGVEEDDTSGQGKPTDAIASELGTRYLVWKDEHGNLGFGNVKYPEAKDISHVHVDGGWKEVVN